jgi:hypothetical protein
MKKHSHKDTPTKPVSAPETEITPVEPDVDPFLKKKRVQNMVLRRMLNQIKGNEDEASATDSSEN